MNRRSVLAALATGTAALAGCLGDSDGENGDDDGVPTPEPTPTASPTPTPENPVDLTVEAVTVAPQVVMLDTPDSIATYGGRDEQFLLAEITTSDEMAPGDLTLTAGGEEYEPREWIGEGLSLYPYGDLYFATEGETGWVAFELPKPFGSSSATLAWPGGSEALAAAVVGALNREPTSFDVTVDAPEQVPADSPATLSVSVANTGDATGTFVGALNRTGPSVAYTPETAVELTVEPGATDTWEYSYTPDLEDAGAAFTFVFVWRDGNERREIGILEPEESDGESGSDSS